jgi:hypothetical protein
MKRRFDTGGVGAILQAAHDNPRFALGKAIANGYLIALLAAFAGLFAALFRAPPPPYVWTVFMLALALVLVRSLFLVSMAQVESRYIIECVPAIEMAVVLGLASFRKKRAR